MAWRDRSVGKGSLIFADNRLYLYSEDGVVGLADASPDGYRERGRFTLPQQSGSPTWSHPIIAGGLLVIRDQDAVYTYDVRAQLSRGAAPSGDNGPRPPSLIGRTTLQPDVCQVRTPDPARGGFLPEMRHARSRLDVGVTTARSADCCRPVCRLPTGGDTDRHAAARLPRRQPSARPASRHRSTARRRVRRSAPATARSRPASRSARATRSSSCSAPAAWAPSTRPSITSSASPWRSR